MPTVPRGRRHQPAAAHLGRQEERTGNRPDDHWQEDAPREPAVAAAALQHSLAVAGQPFAGGPGGGRSGKCHDRFHHPDELRRIRHTDRHRQHATDEDIRDERDQHEQRPEQHPVDGDISNRGDDGRPGVVGAKPRAGSDEVRIFAKTLDFVRLVAGKRAHHSVGVAFPLIDPALQPTSDVAAARDGRLIMETREKPLAAERLEHAQGKRRAADAAAGETERRLPGIVGAAAIVSQGIGRLFSRPDQRMLGLENVECRDGRDGVLARCS